MPKKRAQGSESALYVRLPAGAAAKLDRAAGALGVHKKDLIAGLVSKHVDPDSRRGLNALSVLSGPRVLNGEQREPVQGSYAFRPHDLPEVLDAVQAAELLQIEPKLVLELAAAGKLPGRKLGAAWRFSRSALIVWLSGPSKR